MKTTLKYGFANAHIKDSTSVLSIKADIPNQNFTVVYKSSPTTKYVYRFDATASFLFGLSLMSSMDSAGKFAQEIKKSSDNVWKVTEGNNIGILIESK